MTLVTTVLGVALGLALGGFVGLRWGRRFRARRKAYWTLNVAVVLGCAALDLLGLTVGNPVLAYAALGLMGGLITGMKYGYSDGLREWHDSPTADETVDESMASTENADGEAVAVGDCGVPSVGETGERHD